MVVDEGPLLLKDTARIVPFDNYLWVIEGITGFRHIALPFEVALLTLCDGTVTQDSLAEIVSQLLSPDSSVDDARNTVHIVLSKFAPTLRRGNGNVQPLRYSFADYLYPVDPIMRHPERLPSPVEILFTLTNKCNLRCVYCFNNSGIARTDELSTSEWLDLVCEADDIGIQKIHLSGGEPFAHRGAVQILREIKRRDLLVEVATNGTRSYSDEVFEMLSGSRVDISLDTCDEDLYARLTGSRSFHRVLANIEAFVRAGSSVSIKSCITSLNYTNIAKLYSLLADIGVADVGLAAYTTSVSGRGGDELKLSPDMIASVRSQFENIQQVPETSLTFGIPNPCWQARSDIISCDALVTTVIVMPNGDVTPCELITDTEELCFGNVRSESLTQIWTNPKVEDFFYRKSHPEIGACTSCAFAESCQTGCFAEKLYLGTPLYGPDPRCRISTHSTAITRTPVAPRVPAMAN